MSAAAIKAGKAWVELALKDRTDQGLSNAKRKFLRWGMSLAAVGSAMTAAAGSIIGSLTAAAKVFADTGSQIFDLGRATGMSAEDLSALGYAAEQSDASLSDIGASMKSLSKFSGKVAAGNKQAIHTLDQLGVSSEAFLAASPYQKFLLIADALQSITDPSLRSALGLKVLGSSAQALGSLMAEGAAGIEQLVKEAKRLNIVITQAEADKADALGDAWGAVGKQFRHIAFVTGMALADNLKQIADTTQRLLADVIDFVKNNQGLIKGLALVAAGAFAVGVSLTALGVAASIAAVAMKGLAVAMAFLTNPAGLIVTGIVAAAGAWLFFTEAGQAARDAMAAGNWGLVGDLIMAQLNVAFATGIGALKVQWLEFDRWMKKSGVAEWLGERLLEGSAMGGMGASALLGVDVLEEQRKLNEMNRQRAAKGLPAFGSALDEARNNLKDDLKPGVIDQQHQEKLDEVARRLLAAEEELARRIAEAAKLREDQFEKRKPPPPDRSQGNAGSPLEPGFAAGTFNAAATALISSSAESLQQRMAASLDRIADASERTADATEEMDFSDAE